MSSLNASHEAVSAPSQSQLALALAIVKLKPAHVDIKDHILKIREQIKHGSDPIRTSFPEKHLDSVAFWQQAYEKSEATQSKLLDRIYELEQRNEALLLKLQPKESEGTKAQGQGKRKSKANEVISAPLKRAKTQIPTSCDATAGRKFGSCGDVVGGFEPLQGSPFMRQIYTLQSTLHKRSSRSSIVLAVASLCKSAEDVLRMLPCEASAPKGRTKTSLQVHNPQQDASSILNGAQYAYVAVYQALDKLSGGNETTLETGQVIYHAVSLFESLMELLRRNSKTNVEDSLDKGPSKRQKKVAKPKASKAIGKHQASNKEEEDGLATHISSVLCNMMLHLNPSRKEHKNLLEGYLFVLLNRIGKVLSVFVFGDLQLRPDLRADTTKLPLPAGLTATCLDDTNLKAMEGEAKYLISILERTIHLLGSLYGSSHSIIASKEGDTAGHGQSRDMPLPLQVKKKLQNTLLSAVFGDEPLFKDCLKRPSFPGKAELEKLLAREPVSDNTVSDWFVQEVWTLLGWDILMKNDKN